LRFTFAKDGAGSVAVGIARRQPSGTSALHESDHRCQIGGVIGAVAWRSPIVAAGDDLTLIEAPGAWPLVGRRAKAGDLRAAQTGQTRS
jgi:hypothetical protein